MLVLPAEHVARREKKMWLPIVEGELNNINEIWDDGPNSIQVVTANHRTIRITARGNIRSGSVPKYVAHYEEQSKLSRLAVSVYGFGQWWIFHGRMEPTFNSACCLPCGG